MCSTWVQSRGLTFNFGLLSSFIGSLYRGRFPRLLLRAGVVVGGDGKGSAIFAVVLAVKDKFLRPVRRNMLDGPWLFISDFGRVARRYGVDKVGFGFN